jgi:hypothetical protein
LQDITIEQRKEFVLIVQTWSVGFGRFHEMKNEPGGPRFCGLHSLNGIALGLGKKPFETTLTHKRFTHFENPQAIARCSGLLESLATLRSVFK